MIRGSHLLAIYHAAQSSIFYEGGRLCPPWNIPQPSNPIFFRRHGVSDIYTYISLPGPTAPTPPRLFRSPLGLGHDPDRGHERSRQVRASAFDRSSPRWAPYSKIANAHRSRAIAQLRACKPIPEAQVREICHKARELLIEEGNVVTVTAPVTVRRILRHSADSTLMRT